MIEVPSMPLFWVWKKPIKHLSKEQQWNSCFYENTLFDQIAADYDQDTNFDSDMDEIDRVTYSMLDYCPNDYIKAVSELDGIDTLFR